jgi:hypothetical protein
MKFMKRLPFIRIDTTIINLENLNTIWYDDSASYAANYVLGYRMFNDTEPYVLTFSTKKKALEALDTIMTAIDIPVIDEDD